MTKYRLCYDKKKCIGATACTALFPKYFKMGKDNKAELLSSKKEKNIQFVEITEDLKNKAEAAIKACPTSAIYLEVVNGKSKDR